jgi:hypothetical protein
MLIKNNLTERFNWKDNKFVEVRTRLTPLRTNQFGRSIQRRNFVPEASDNISRNIVRILRLVPEVQIDLVLKEMSLIIEN